LFPAGKPLFRDVHGLEMITTALTVADEHGMMCIPEDNIRD
jgi:hypothetical protein